MTSLPSWRFLALAVPLALVPAPARAQHASAPFDNSPAPVVRAAGAIRASQSLTGGITVSPRRDTLWNGIAIGAGLGALVGALGGATAIECSECAGFNVPLTFGVLGAAAGAGIGAAVDALRHSRPGTSATTNRRPRVTVAPSFGRHGRALIASVRF